MNASIQDTAQQNLRALAHNPYPGRGLVVGLDQSGKSLVQVYWIMGRSKNSRNRIFDTEFGRLWTDAADPSEMKDPTLVIYEAMAENDGHYVVSNGHQTLDVLEACFAEHGVESGLARYRYEPDAPNYTPRITGIVSLRESRPAAEIAILRKSPFDDSCDRHFFRYERLGAGFGRCITTYAGDGDPLPSFQGEPFLVPLLGSIGDIRDLYWAALNEENRISLAVKFISKDSGESTIEVMNKYSRTSVSA